MTALVSYLVYKCSHYSISVLRSEVGDLRLVLQSSDKELAAVKKELSDGHTEQQRELLQLSNRLIGTQLQLDKVQ